MRTFWIAALPAAILLAVAGCGGGSGEAETPAASASAPPMQSPPAAETEAPPTPAPTEPLEALYSPVVLAYRGINNLVTPSMESEGLEFVLGAPRELLEEVDRITVYVPDGRTYDLNPSTDLGVSLDFFGLYGTGEPPPPLGEYVFEITKKDGEVLEVVNDYPGSEAPLPSWVNVEIDRAAGTIEVSWEDLPEVRNYTVGLQLIDQQTRAYTFVEEPGCPPADIVDPNALDESYLTEGYCLMADLNEYLTPGVEYGVQVAVWSDLYYGGIDGAEIFTW